MPTPPVLDAEKRTEGFQRSLALRRLRAEFKTQLNREGVSYLMDHWGMDVIQGMRVFDLLRALPGVGPARAQRIMAAAGIELRRTVARLGPRQRDRLFAVLDS